MILHDNDVWDGWATYTTIAWALIPCYAIPQPPPGGISQQLRAAAASPSGGSDCGSPRSTKGAVSDAAAVLLPSFPDDGSAPILSSSLFSSLLFSSEALSAVLRHPITLSAAFRLVN